MGKIKPTFTLTANKSSASANPGPLSIALSLNATDLLDVTAVQSKIIDVDGTQKILWAEDHFDDGVSDEAGKDGGFVYIKNLRTTANEEVFIGWNSGATDLAADNLAARIMTLEPGEFCWMPWDFTNDLIVDADTSYTNAVESWVFTRTTTGT